VDYGDVSCPRHPRPGISAALLQVRIHGNIDAAAQLDHANLFSLPRAINDNPDPQGRSLVERLATRAALIETVNSTSSIDVYPRAPAGLTGFSARRRRRSSRTDFRTELDKPSARSTRWWIRRARRVPSQIDHPRAAFTANFSLRACCRRHRESSILTRCPIVARRNGSNLPREKFASFLVNQSERRSRLEWVNPKPHGNTIRGYATATGDVPWHAGTVMTRDGVAWTVRAIPGKQNLRADLCERGSSRWARSASSSTDGVTGRLAASTRLPRLAMSHMVAESSSRSVGVWLRRRTHIDDGLSWTAFYPAFSRHCLGAFTGSQFVAVGSTNNTQNRASSVRRMHDLTGRTTTAAGALASVRQRHATRPSVEQSPRHLHQRRHVVDRSNGDHG